jgi:hypothetical protein
MHAHTRARKTRWDTYRLSANYARGRAQRGTPLPCARGVELMRWGARPQCAEDAWALPRAARHTRGGAERKVSGSLGTQ